MEAARRTEITISATSGTSFEDAIEEGFTRASMMLREAQDVRIKEQRLLLEGGNIVGYRVDLEVVFDIEEAEGGEHSVVLRREEYDRLTEAEEELEDLRAYDEAIMELRTGEDELTPWVRAKERIAEEREELRRRGAV